MKNVLKPLIATAIIGLSPLAVLGGTITSITPTDTNTGYPTAGDFTAAETSQFTAQSQFQVADNRNFVGQSFTLGSAGDDGYLFNSIAFQIVDQGTATTSADGLALSIFLGADFTAEPLSEINFGTGTFDASADQVVTFGLTATESANLGTLTAGTEYSAVLSVEDDVADGGAQFRIARGGTADNLYAGGDGIFANGRVTNTDSTFQINATIVPGSSVPEPSSLALLGLCGVVSLTRRRRP